MRVWDVDLAVRRPLPHYPQPRHVACEIRRDTRYYCECGPHREPTTAFIVYGLEGEGEVRDAAGTHRVYAGQAFLCRAADPAFTYYYPADAPGPWRFVWFAFAEGPVPDLVNDLTARFGPVFSYAPETTIVKTLLQFAQQDGRRVELSPFVGARLVMDALGALGEAAEPHPAADGQAILVRWAQEAVARSLEQPFGVNELARHLRVSREHLSRVFREQTGLPPQDYILREKMRHACRLLRDTPLSGKEIATRLGYARPTNFTRAFRRVVGVTPNRFRSEAWTPVL